MRRSKRKPPEGNDNNPPPPSKKAQLLNSTTETEDDVITPSSTRRVKQLVQNKRKVSSRNTRQQISTEDDEVEELQEVPTSITKKKRTQVFDKRKTGVRAQSKSTTEVSNIESLTEDDKSGNTEDNEIGDAGDKENIDREANGSTAVQESEEQRSHTAESNKGDLKASRAPELMTEEHIDTPNDLNHSVQPGQQCTLNSVDSTVCEDGVGIIRNEDGSIQIGDIYISPPPLTLDFDTSRPRLMITNITNENFKSYAGNKQLGPFHKSFTAIVGPNGSGKSNVIDSMLFVFGYRAQKIRSKKISVLIHNSSEHPDIMSCTVAVHFQQIIDKPKSDDFDVVPDSKFVVSRTAHKDSSSYYQIDKRRVQFREVAQLLRGHGIDLDHNRFLILQGEVEQIALMKPKGHTEHECGMLEFLEDIIGSVRLKEPIEKLHNQLEEYNQVRSEKVQRLRIVENEKSILQPEYDAALDYLKLSNQCTRVENQILQLTMYNSLVSKERAEKEKEGLQKEYDEIQEKLGTYKRQQKEKDADLKIMSQEIDRKAKEEDILTQKYKKYDSRDAKLKEDLVQCNNRRKKTAKNLKEEKVKLAGLKEIPAKNAADIEEITDLQKRFEEDRVKASEELTIAMNSISKETKPFQEEKEKFENELIALEKQVNETKGVLEIAKSEYDIFLSTERNEKKKLTDLQQNIQNIRNQLQEKQKRIPELQKLIPETENNLAAAEQELQQNIPEVDVVSGELRSQRLQLEEMRSSMQQSRSKGQILDSLLDEKRKGNIPGIFGRLGDLAAIDAKYDVAISTACGSLDNILVDNVTTGQQCIEHLKQYKLGRANFIALDKQTHWLHKCNSRIQTPENIPRLYDLITVKEDRVRPAFYFALRDTLVANDLNQASRIAYGAVRHRVVTLKGELIEPSGTMSGGGNSVMRGKMRRSVSANDDVTPAQLEACQRKLDELAQRHNQLQERQLQLERNITLFRKQILEMQHEVQTVTVNVTGLIEQETSLKVEVQKQEKKVREVVPDENAAKGYEKKIVLAQKDYDKAAASALKVSTKRDELDAKIKSVRDNKVQPPQKKVDKINKKLGKVATEITRLTVEIKTSERNLKKTTEKIESMEKDVTDREDEIKQLQAEQTEIVAQVTKMLEELEALKLNIEELKGKYMEKKKEQHGVSKEETQLKERIIELTKNLDIVKSDLQSNNNRSAKAKKDLSELKLQKIVDMPLPPLDKYTPDEIQEFDEKELYDQKSVLEEQIRKSKPNLKVIDEYMEKDKVYLQRVVELEKFTELRDRHRRFWDEIRKQRTDEFLAGFLVITAKLKEMYQMITLGGDAELELVDSLDPFAEGIVFSVRPPSKSWKVISNLSGGEKTLSSLALIFALHHYKPTPLYVMDEIDAALDFRNVSIVGNYIKDRTKNAQFVIISLRSNMFELADRIVGIYKTKNCTSSITVNTTALNEKAARCASRNTQATAQANNQVTNQSQQSQIPVDQDKS